MLERLGEKSLLTLHIAMAAVLLTGLAVSWMGRQGVMGPAGVPLAADLLKHHTAGRMVTEGRSGELYSGGHLGRRVHEACTGKEAEASAGGYDFVYPPLVAAVASWAAGLPYLAWALGFQGLLVLLHGVTWVLLVRAGLKPDLCAWAAWWGLPVFHYNLIIGQNGGLSLAIMAGSVLLLARGWPWAAGLVAACVAYKPQLAPLLVVFMVLAGQWRWAAGMAVGSAVWGLFSLALMGWDAHAAWLDALRRMSSGQHQVFLDLNPSVPGFLGAWGGRVLQGGASLAGLVVLAWNARSWRKRPDPGRILVAGLAGLAVWSPYMMYYDMLLAAPLALAAGRGRGWRAKAGALMFWSAALLSVNFLGCSANPATPLLLVWWCLAAWPERDVGETDARLNGSGSARRA